MRARPKEWHRPRCAARGEAGAGGMAGARRQPLCCRVPGHARDGFHVPRVGLPMSHIRAMFGVQVLGQVGVQTWSWVVLERFVFIRQPK